jgi:hypothetical protein
MSNFLTEEEPTDSFFLTLKPPLWKMPDAEFIALCRRTWEEAKEQSTARYERLMAAMSYMVSEETTKMAAAILLRREAGLERKVYRKRKYARTEKKR